MEMPSEQEPVEGIVLLVTRHQAAHTSTVFVTRAAATVPGQTHAAPTTTARATAAPATTAQQTTQEQARATVHYVPSMEPRGTVVAQSPAGGTTAPTSAQVTINVSSGRNTEGVSVPSTIGMTIPQAVSTVQSAGLHLVMLRRTVTDQAEAGKVVAQTPAAGQQAPKNSRIVVYMGAFKG